MLTAMRHPLAAACLALAALQAAPAAAQDQQAPGRQGWPCAGRLDPTYLRAAEATGGQLFLFHPSEIADSGALMAASFTHRETLVRAAGTMQDGLHAFEVTIDGSVESVLFSVTVQCLQIVEIERPSGAMLQASDEGADDHLFEAGRVVTLRAPEPGTWTVRASGRGVFAVVVQARSALALGQVQLLERSGAELLPTIQPGAAGSRQLVAISLGGSTGAWHAGLVSATGESLGAVAAVRQGPGSAYDWIGELTVPRVPFRIAVSGVDAAGLPFVRVHAPLLGLVPR